ncbi:MAG TPA: FAD-binding oxidoreductase [Candidatus Lustribacter sp.]|nr:FAD-binding oxidoreductase [Candidatus Lustribacter sp.]
MTASVAPRIVRPADATEVAATLAACARERAAVVVVGGSTLQSLGNAPRRCDVALHTSVLRGIRDYDPRDMTAGIDAGTTLAEVARVLGEHGQWIPFDAPLPARATVGGTLAAGWAGPRRAAYGRPRDLVIGSTIALTDGTLARAGGMVVKNVTGYDMSKLYVGSLGTLGAIVRANFKALPRPAAHRLAVAPIAGDQRERTLAALGALAIEPTAALVLDGFARVARYPGAALRLVLLFEGSEAVVDRAVRDARSALGRAGIAETLLHDGEIAQHGFADIVDAYVDAGERALTYRTSGLPSTAWARTRAAHALAREHGLHAESIADLRTGDAILRFSARTIATFAAKLGAFDADVRRAFERATVLAGGGTLRAAIDAWGAPPSTIATMRAIKTHFDPAGILAPGRYVGAI